MSTTEKNVPLTKVIIPGCRVCYVNIWTPRKNEDGVEKYSLSCLISKEDKETLRKVHKAVEAAKEAGKDSKWNGKIPPNLKLPLRDGDIDRAEDDCYEGCFFFNATSNDAPQVVNRRVQPITDTSMVYSGCYCNVSVNFYPYNVKGNKGVAAGLGNVQFVRDGERLSGRPSAESEFEAIDEEEFEDILGDMDEDDIPDYLR